MFGHPKHNYTGHSWRVSKNAVLPDCGVTSPATRRCRKRSIGEYQHHFPSYTATSSSPAGPSALPNRTTFPSVFPSYYTTSDSTVGSSNVQWLKCESFPSGKGEHFVAIQCWIRVVASKPHTKSCCSRNPLYTDQDFNSKLSSLAATMCGHDAMMIKMKEA